MEPKPTIQKPENKGKPTFKSASYPYFFSQLPTFAALD
jgi:hypothetical protein